MSLVDQKVFFLLFADEEHLSEEEDVPESFGSQQPEGALGSKLAEGGQISALNMQPKNDWLLVNGKMLQN